MKMTSCFSKLKYSYFLHTRVALPAILILIISSLPSCAYENTVGTIGRDVQIEIVDSVTVLTYSKNLLYVGFLEEKESLFFVDNTLDSLQLISIRLTDRQQNIVKVPKIGVNGIGRKLSGAHLTKSGVLFGVTNKSIFSISPSGQLTIRLKYNAPLYDGFDRKSHAYFGADTIVHLSHTFPEGSVQDLRHPDFFKEHQHFTKINLTTGEIGYTGTIAESDFLIPNPGYRKNSFHHDVYRDRLYMCITPSQELFEFGYGQDIAYLKKRKLPFPEFNAENPNTDIYIGLLGSSQYTGMSINDLGTAVITYETGVPLEEIESRTYDPDNDGPRLYEEHNTYRATVFDLESKEEFTAELPKKLRAVSGTFGNQFIFSQNPFTSESKKGQIFYLTQVKPIRN